MFNVPCNITVDLPDIPGPTYVFYRLTNFYQNHRRYVKSKSNNQLANVANVKDTDIKKFCEPVTQNGDLFEWQKSFYINKDNIRTTRSDQEKELKTLVPSAVANPCGLIAKSFFNDTFKLFQNTNRIPISEEGITWNNDVGQKYKSGNKTTQWIDVENEHFIVWMRTSGLPEFRKLWGVIPDGIKKETFVIEIQNNYDPDTFKGSKSLIFSNSGAFGGKNQFLGIAYLVVGSVCFVIAIFFCLQSRYSGGNYGQKVD